MERHSGVRCPRFSVCREPARPILQPGLIPWRPPAPAPSAAGLRQPTTPATDNPAARAALPRRRSRKCDQDPPRQDVATTARQTAFAPPTWPPMCCRARAPSPRQTARSTTARPCPGDTRHPVPALLPGVAACNPARPAPTTATRPASTTFVPPRPPPAVPGSPAAINPSRSNRIPYRVPTAYPARIASIASRIRASTRPAAS
jgi:hypothetical protein